MQTPLLERNLIRKPDLLVLQRLRAELAALIASNQATIARAGQVGVRLVENHQPGLAEQRPGKPDALALAAAEERLMRLSPVQARASFSARQRQWHRFEAERLRLQALEQEAGRDSGSGQPR